VSTGISSTYTLLSPHACSELFNFFDVSAKTSQRQKLGQVDKFPLKVAKLLTQTAAV
jgi:hypothetical protein